MIMKRVGEKMLPDSKNNNHIGHKNWKRLSPSQQRAIRKDRQNARRLLDEFKKQNEDITKFKKS